ncbi:MAG: alpha/beta hydrolase [Opitutaceae bacterium]|nr:alpha/beta hydrolase [Opitutaceae bacterium]
MLAPLLLVLLSLTLLTPVTFAAGATEKSAPAAKSLVRKAPKAAPDLPTPTQANVAYGTHERHVLDFWRANSSSPTPLVFFIHGGGWTGGDKNRVTQVQAYLAAGMSVVSINYRMVPQAQAAGVKPPVQWPLHDAARALQFVRSRAREWNIDKARIGASGGSAGACSSLWLAFHDDLAQPGSADPIARESTRLWCAAVNGAQTTLDPRQMKDWTPNSRYGGHAFGFTGDKAKNLSQFDEFLANRDQILPWIAEYSPYALVSPDDPPVYLFYAAPPALGQDQKDPTHTSNFGVKLEEKLREHRVPCELVYPGASDVKHPQIHDYLITTLKAPAAEKTGTAKTRKTK